MNEVQVMQERYRSKQLTSESLNVRAWKWHEAAGFQKVENREPE